MRELLESRRVICHPLVIGELACGTLDPREQILAFLQRLPTPVIASHVEVLAFIEQRNLWGTGLGYIDIHLLASALLTDIPLWTSDKHLRAAARALNVAYE